MNGPQHGWLTPGPRKPHASAALQEPSTELSCLQRLQLLRENCQLQLRACICLTGFI